MQPPLVVTVGKSASILLVHSVKNLRLLLDASTRRRVTLFLGARLARLRLLVTPHWRQALRTSPFSEGGRLLGRHALSLRPWLPTIDTPLLLHHHHRAGVI